MYLYLMRHGPAEDEAPSGRDRDRVLTPDGKDVVRAVLATWTEEAPKEVRTSPFVRAQQTAELVAERFGVSIHEEEDLALEENAMAVVRRLEQEPREGVMLVGHEPDLSRLGYLLTGKGVSFGRGTVVALARVAGKYGLRWRIDPARP